MTATTRGESRSASIVCSLVCAWAIATAFAGLATARSLDAPGACRSEIARADVRLPGQAAPPARR
jgi:hypothetical protein